MRVEVLCGCICYKYNAAIVCSGSSRTMTSFGVICVVCGSVLCHSIVAIKLLTPSLKTCRKPVQSKEHIRKKTCFHQSLVHLIIDSASTSIIFIIYFVFLSLIKGKVSEILMLEKRSKNTMLNN